MNSSQQYCANCRLHGWKQLEDKTQLKRCKSCKVIEYCGKECQREHWKKIHKNQCKFFVNSANTKEWGHKEDNCLICRQAAAVGKSELKKPVNPNYGCIYKDFKFPQNYCHARPFPITGLPGDTLEKAIIVLWHLLHKFGLTRCRGVRGSEGLEKAFTTLMEYRLSIWDNRKDFPHPENMLDLGDDLFRYFLTICRAIERNELVTDPLQLWNTLQRVVSVIFGELCFCSNTLKTLKDPLIGLPDEFKELLTQALGNQAKFLALADQVLDALATQVIPYQDVLKIICGGSLIQICSFCSVEIVIAGVNVAEGSPMAFFSILSMETYSCGKGSCIGKATNKLQDRNRLIVAVTSLRGERLANRCDFCLQLPPKNDVYRCSECLTTMYCSKTCQNKDWKIHMVGCKKDVEERKKKFGASVRRKMARENLEIFEETLTDVEKEMGFAPMPEVNEVVEKFKLKNAKKKSNK